MLSIGSRKRIGVGRFTRHACPLQYLLAKLDRLDLPQTVPDNAYETNANCQTTSSVAARKVLPKGHRSTSTNVL
eukprot:3847322-Pyramimonas_sp.AAC.1